MADDFIQIGLDGQGKKIDSDSLSVNGQTVYRERDRLAGSGATDLAEVRSTEPGPTDGGVVTREAPPISPQYEAFANFSLAGQTAISFDCTSIPGGLTGHLTKVIVACSRQGFFTIKSVTSGGAETVLGYVIVNDGTAEFVPPHRKYQTAQSSGLFRVTADNFDTSPAGVYATVYWDQY